MLEEEGGAGGGGEAPPPAAAPAAQAPAAFDAKALAKEFAGALDEREQRREAQAPKTYTPEEIAEARKKLKFWEPDDTFITEFGNLDTQKQAFGKLRDGLMAQNIEIVKALLEQERAQWQEQFRPVQQMLTQREEAERESRFHEAFPTLNKPKLKPLIFAVGAELAKQGKFNGLSESEAFTELAKGVESVIKETNPEFNLGATTTSAPTGRSGNEIPVNPAGSGGGGSNGSGGGAKALSTAASILGPIRRK